jgi:hypothetical protein
MVSRIANVYRVIMGCEGKFEEGEKGSHDMMMNSVEGV